MKRFIITSLTALSLLLAAQQQASAWHKFKFSIGMSISCEGADNSWLFGMFKGGPAPAGAFDGPYAGAPGPYSAGMTGGGFAANQPAAPGPVYGAAPAAGQPGVAQPVNYSYYPQGGGYPSTGGYQAPYQGQAAPQAPSYWYDKR